MDCITQKKKLAIYALLLSTLISRKLSELNVERSKLYIHLSDYFRTIMTCS